LTGCVTTTVNVIDRKPVSRPFSRVLCFYLEEGCDFSLFDSTVYNICLRDHARQDSGYAERAKQESVIADALSTQGTLVWPASYWLDPARSSYGEFRHFVDSMKIDGLLIVGSHNYWHEEHTVRNAGTGPVYGYKGTLVVGGTPGYASNVVTLNGNLQCDLFATQSMIGPVWKAEIGEKGNSNSTKSGLTRKSIRQVVESLKSSQYVAH
jgi:hypothetical protein